jgi:hypothetical protein
MLLVLSAEHKEHLAFLGQVDDQRAWHRRPSACLPSALG